MKIGTSIGVLGLLMAAGCTMQLVGPEPAQPTSTIPVAAAPRVPVAVVPQAPVALTPCGEDRPCATTVTFWYPTGAITQIEPLRRGD
jgi:hypothetical protein